MFRLTVLSLALVGLATAAEAADLPANSRLGEIFVEPPPPRVAAPRIVAGGYYGKPNSFRYRSYYGTPPHVIFGRLPYACGQYGYC